MKDGNNITHMVKKLSIRFDNAAAPYNPVIDREFVFKPSLFPTMNFSKFYLNGKAYNIPGVFIVLIVHFLVSTPWFDCWRHLFISNLDCHEHEFLTRYLGCLFVVTTRNPDTLGAISSLVQQQAQLLKSQPFRWFSSTNILLKHFPFRFTFRGTKVFQTLTSTYGNANCYFLDLGSSSNFSDSWKSDQIEEAKSVLKPQLTRPH
ncbi:unnamed protein product, partial [Hydatigera taeniaeformis]|uniref:Transmembrane protein n=1 Tax=Hydatigena taeniaeformis TaxID=6205 RepID=A0A0R3XAG8_HYDTA